MDYKNITLEVIALAKETGKFLLEEINKVKIADIEVKGLHDFVSYVDKTAEGRIVKRLAEILPESGFLTEEQTATHRGERFNWIVDPLDGTTNFLHHIPLFSVSIALMEYDKIVAGVVYEPNLDECFYAWKDGNAYMNDTEIYVSAGSTGISNFLPGLPATLPDCEGLAPQRLILHISPVDVTRAFTNMVCMLGMWQPGLLLFSRLAAQ
jgi:myo-inositol-1(or 4)-monophosphatase